MFLAAAPPKRRVNTREVATAYGISAHHLQKAALSLARLGYIESLPGRGGGIRLARDPGDIRLGALVAATEGAGCLVDCNRGPCPLAGKCLLKGILDRAERVFIEELNKVTLADVIARSTGVALGRMMSLLPEPTFQGPSSR
jgi:Rrf2 family nitric oxide-sensitive transcriptional repressor